MDEFGFTVSPELLLVDPDGNVLGSWDETMNADRCERFLIRLWLRSNKRRVIPGAP